MHQSAHAHANRVVCVLARALAFSVCARGRRSRAPCPRHTPPPPRPSAQDGAELDDKFKDVQFMANMAYVKYEGSDPWFYFCRDAFTESKF